MPLLSCARRTGRYLADNVLGLLALVVALSGTAYAVDTIGSEDIIDNSVASADIKNATIQRTDMAWAKWQKIGAGSPQNCELGAVAEFCNDYEDEFIVPKWENYGAGWQGGRYRRNATGEVTLQGLVRAANFPTGAIFVLPSGYRPTEVLLFLVNAGSSAGDVAAGVRVNPDGTVNYRGGAAADDPSNWVSLTGVSFPTG